MAEREDGREGRLQRGKVAESDGGREGRRQRGKEAEREEASKRDNEEKDRNVIT